MRFLKCKVEQKWTAYAKRKYTGKKFNHMTIMESGRGQIVGTLGEIAFRKYLYKKGIKYNYVADQKLPYDFVVNDIKIDVKTKLCTSNPKSTYSCHVNTSQKNYDADLYVFARTDKQNVWLLGYIHKSDFWNPLNQDAKDVKEGDDDDGFVERENSRKILINNLIPMSHFDSEQKSIIDWLKRYNAYP